MGAYFRLIAVLFIMGMPATSFAALGDYFVSTEWLAKNRQQAVVVDVRKGPLYLLGHIEGAQHVPRDEFLETRNNVKSLVPSAPSIADMLGKLGVTPETTVVVYADDNNPYAARLVWTLHYHGHKKSYVLDGGYDKWAAEGLPTSLFPSAKPEPTKYQMSTDAECSDSRAVADDVYTRLHNPTTVIWDTRSDGEYTGMDVRADRGGHIPGAVHLNWTDLQTERQGIKVLKSRDEIVALLNSHGITFDKEIIAHCQTGIRSSYATLVLLGLGYKSVKNYDGSWIEWANNPSLPIINTDGQEESAVKVSSN